MSEEILATKTERHQVALRKNSDFVELTVFEPLWRLHLWIWRFENLIMNAEILATKTERHQVALRENFNFVELTVFEPLWRMPLLN